MSRLRDRAAFQPLMAIPRKLLDQYYWPKTRNSFLAMLEDVSTVEEAIETAWRFEGAWRYFRIRPAQDRMEIAVLAERVRELEPEIIVEIGTRHGGTLFIWSQVSKTLKLLISIDLPEDMPRKGYFVERIKLYQLFTANQPQCQLELLRMDSQQESTHAMVEKLLGGRRIDFLFLDGDHNYAGVKRDYQMYSELVRPGGLIALHDIRRHKSKEWIQVYRVWDEIRADEDKTEEIIRQPFTGQYGIGVMTKSDS